MKKLFCVLLSMLLVMSLFAGCASGKSASGEIKVAIVQQLDHSSLDEIRLAVEAELDRLAKEKNLTITYTEFNGRNDLTIDGKKFSGNAQYRLGDCVVHHGSLLFDTNIRQMVESTTVDSYKILSKSIKSVRDRVTNIAEHLPAPMDADTFKECMVRHIMGSSGAVYEITPEDDKRIREIAAEKFNNWERIYGADPKFNIERTGRLAGGKMQFKIDVQKGIIRHAAVYGDFFSTLDAETICAALVGCRYERSAVLEALQAHGIDGAVYRISAREMASVIAD